MVFGRPVAGVEHLGALELFGATTGRTQQVMVIVVVGRGQLKPPAALRQFQFPQQIQP